VDLDDVKSESQRYGALAYVGSGSPSGTPYVSPVSVAWVDDEIVAFVASSEAKVANVRTNPRCSVHYAVSEATNWDSCVVWGVARLVETVEGRRALWDRMGYDLSAFEPGGPEAGSHAFIAVAPDKAVVLRTYGTLGRETWSRS
jgi:nitroimidazol reductase NimA-like FMN-containing flavoprotein (pyridoxamine 5'-phosphate oxidase superfamily)